MAGRSRALLRWQLAAGVRLASRFTPRTALLLLAIAALLAMLLLPPGWPHPDLRHPAIAPTGDGVLPWSALAMPDAQTRDHIDSLRRAAAGVSDADDRAESVWLEMQALQRLARGNPAVDGRLVRIIGYVVPLERNRDGLRSLLLVPYFGACIHAPPPPANQVIYIALDKPQRGLRTMDIVSAEGRLVLERQDKELAASSYRLAGATLAPARVEFQR
jgi:uncharacterized protein